MRIPGDPRPPVEDALIDLYGAEVSGVGWELDENWHPDMLPYVVIADDGGPLTWPVSGSHTIRVTLYGGDKPPIRALALRGLGRLHDKSQIPVGLADILSSGSVVIEDKDPDTGAYLASFTVTATVRTVEIA